MKLTIPLEIKVFHHTDETRTKEDMDLPVTSDEFDLTAITIYDISSIGPYEEDGEDHCIIYSGGNAFVSIKSYEELKELIEKHHL